MIPGEENEPINLPKLLVVEGKDSQHFMEALLKHIGLSGSIEVRNLGSIHQVRDRLKDLTLFSGFANVESLGVIRDAEHQPASSAFQSVLTGLDRAGLAKPSGMLVKCNGSPAVSVYILPDCNNPGMLETLCMTAVLEDPAAACIDAYLSCLNGVGLKLPNVDKAKAHAFIASREKPQLQVGTAAYRDYWSWHSPVYDKLKQFLTNL